MAPSVSVRAAHGLATCRPTVIKVSVVPTRSRPCVVIECARGGVFDERNDIFRIKSVYKLCYSENLHHFLQTVSNTSQAASEMLEETWDCTAHDDIPLQVNITARCQLNNRQHRHYIIISKVT